MKIDEARQIIATWLVSSKGAKGQRGYIEGWFDEKDVEAFRMAIEALKAPTENTNTPTDTPTDLISRQAAIDALREEVEWEYDWNDEQWHYIEADMAIGAIERLPSAQPERKKGKWVHSTVYTDSRGCEFAKCKCSNCGHEEFAISYNVTHGKYCPDCGARMEGGEQ